MAGHLFVTRSDLTALSCDAWLVPTDASTYLESYWLQALTPYEPQLRNIGSLGTRRAVPLVAPTPAEPNPVLTNVGGTGWAVQPEWYVQGIKAFIQAALSGLTGRQPKHGRGRLLFALPFVGTGFGGASAIKGSMARVLVDSVGELAKSSGVDLAIVLRNPASFAAMQAARRAATSAMDDAALAVAWDLPAGLAATARALSREAQCGRLVLFLGAGVSKSAGIPLWTELLDALAEDGGLSATEVRALQKLDVLDRARLIQRRLELKGGVIGNRVQALITTRRPSLAHTLLASLPVAEVATTNYDQLFELASEAAGSPTAVLPYQSVARHSRWLLKLHGCVTRPNDIVLTRDDYLQYAERRAALTGIVQALLVTRHMLFVGFSLSDDNFHRLVHDVRKALGTTTTPFGSALILEDDMFLRELWAGELNLLAMNHDSSETREVSALRLDRFLDLLLMLSSSATAHLLDPAFDGVLTDAERDLRELIQRMSEDATPPVRGTTAWRLVERMLMELGSTPRPPG